MLCVGKEYFKHKNIQKNTKVARGRDGMGTLRMMDLVQVKKNELKYLFNVVNERNG